MGISSDGDPRLLSAMVYENSLLNGIRVTQDTIHTCGKGRNRLLKPNIKLPMGSHQVSIEHLRQLVKNVQKSVHGLTFGDIFPIDRMNYGSFEKMVKDRVIIALRNRIPNSEGTVRYLLTFRDIADSFLNFNLTPLERLFLMYRSLFFLRIWRSFIKESNRYKLSENFLTYNTYMCVEINARNLLLIMKECRDRDAHDTFLPALFDSQGCENIFRIFRSMGTTQNTKINFNLLELIYLIGRLEVQQDISYCKLNMDGIKMPHTRKTKTSIYQLPTDEEIVSVITKAKQEAIQTATSFQMILEDYSKIDEYKFKSNLESVDIETHEHADGTLDELANELIEDSDNEANEVSNDAHDDANINDFSPCYQYENEYEDWFNDDDDSNVSKNSRFTEVVDENGVKRIVLKSSLLWSLMEPGLKMSNDRTKRFILSCGWKKKDTNEKSNS